jgi:hypothetical protein
MKERFRRPERVLNYGKSKRRRKWAGVVIIQRGALEA